jgi:hypothetical protein
MSIRGLATLGSCVAFELRLLAGIFCAYQCTPPPVPGNETTLPLFPSDGGNCASDYSVCVHSAAVSCAGVFLRSAEILEHRMTLGSDFGA